MPKKLLFSVLAVILGTAIAYSQNTVKHVVERGETLQSIAQRYGTTVDKIIELNPDAAQIVYLGMELQIPVTQIASSETATANQSPISTNGSNNGGNSEKKTNSSDFKRWNFVDAIAYGIVPKPDGVDVYTSSFNYDATIGFSYNVTKSFYVGARIGYGGTHVLIGGNLNYEYNTHSILIPVELGAKLFLVPDKVALVPNAGLDFGFVVKKTASQGVGSNKKKIKVEGGDNVGARGRLGVRLSLWGFNLGAAMVFPFSKKIYGEKSYPELSLGFGF